MFQRIIAVVFLGLFAVCVMADEEPKPLSGLVVDEKGQPLAGATVTAFEITGSDRDGEQRRALASIVTGSDGRFLFEARKVKKCQLILATKPGKCIDGGSPRAVQLGELVYRLGPAAPLDGTIVDDSGKPIAGVDVKLSFHGNEWMIPDDAVKTKTDVLGRFCFSDLPETATFKLDMSAPNYARSLAKGPFTPRQKSIRFVMPLEGRIEGTLVDEGTGKPLPDVRLWAMSDVPSGQHTAYATTNKAGQFAMRGLSGGNYEIMIDRDSDCKLSEWIVSTEKGESKKVKVEAGKLTSGVRVKAVRGGFLEVVLADAATGQPLRSDRAMVDISPVEDLRIRHSGMPSEDGSFRFCVLPGNYVVTSVMAASAPYTNKKGKPFRVDIGKTTHIVMPLETGKPASDKSAAATPPCVTGIVYDPQGKAVPRAKVRVLPFLASSKDLVTGDNGGFSIAASDVGPFGCMVWIRHPDKDLVALGVVMLGDGDAEEQKEEQRLADVGTAILRTSARKIMLRPPVVLSGVVRTPEGKPVADTAVTARVDASHMGRSAVFATTQSDREGRFRLALADRTITSYAISAIAPGYTNAEKRVDPQDLLPNHESPVNLVLYPNNRSVRGIVKDSQERRVPGVVITAKRMSGHEYYSGCVVSDAQGQFTFEHLDNAEVIYLFAHVPGRGWIQLGSTIDPSQKEVEVLVGPSSWD